jgi:transposase-like protein
MRKVLHGSATTTEAVRRAIQHIQESLRALANRYGVNQKTVAQWRKREGVADLPTDPKEPKSTVLTVEDEAIIVAFCRQTLLPLDDLLYSLQVTIPHLSRSSLLRCLQRHDIERPLGVTGDMAPKKKFKSYPIGPRQRFSNRWRTRWLDQHRHRRGADRRRQASSVRSY